jgi:hypothetical protein
MGMHLVICTLSPKRAALLEEDPELWTEICTSREPVPGLLRIGKAWEALAQIVAPWDAGGGLAALFRASAGVSFGPQGAFGHPRRVEPDEVTALDRIFDQVPRGACQMRAEALRGSEVHGGYFGGPGARKGTLDVELEAPGGGDRAEAAMLDAVLEGVRALVSDAAKRGDAIAVEIT